jgi:hypothetical protein
MQHLDQVPTHVQQLQFTVKNPTVGKAATFVKVDSVINETKTLMNVISKVVTSCFVCATMNINYSLIFHQHPSPSFLPESLLQSLSLTPRAPVLLAYGCAPLLVYLLGRPA